MVYIFMDESGDLGFGKKGSSRYFVVAFLILNDKKILEKMVSKISKTVKKKYRTSGTLHAHREEGATIRRLLKALVVKGGCRIAFSILDKSKVPIQRRQQKHELYNKVVRDLIYKLFSRGIIDLHEVSVLVASQRETNKYLNERFKKEISEEGHLVGNHELGVKIKKPFEEKCLQVIDAVAWAIKRKHEQGDFSYFNIIQSLISLETEIIP